MNKISATNTISLDPTQASKLCFIYTCIFFIRFFQYDTIVEPKKRKEKDFLLKYYRQQHFILVIYK